LFAQNKHLHATGIVLSLFDCFCFFSSAECSTHFLDVSVAWATTAATHPTPAAPTATMTTAMAAAISPVS